MLNSNSAKSWNGNVTDIDGLNIKCDIYNFENSKVDFVLKSSSWSQFWWNKTSSATSCGKNSEGIDGWSIKYI